MIVSYEHNYVFVKTNKTAGTSMEITLSTHTGDGDIITPISPVDELKRLENSNARLPQNYSEDKALEHEYRELIKSGKEKNIEDFQKNVLIERLVFRNHMPAAKIKPKLDAEFFEKAFKFTIQRHPYDRMVSLAYWRRKNPQKDIGVVIDKILDHREINNTHFYKIDGKVAVDFFVLYERLREGMEEVEQKIGAAGLWDQMPKTKHEIRTDRRPAKDVLTDEQKRRIAQQCKEEFEMFGYET